MKSTLAGLQALLQIMLALRGLLEVGKSIWSLLLEAQRQQREKEIVDAFKKLKETGDVRDLERAIGSINSGKPTTNPHPDIGERPARDRSE
jgi:hypothetical protein